MDQEHITITEYEEVLRLVHKWAEDMATSREHCFAHPSLASLLSRDLSRSKRITDGLTSADNLLRAIYLDVKELFSPIKSAK